MRDMDGTARDIDALVTAIAAALRAERRATWERAAGMARAMAEGWREKARTAEPESALYSFYVAKRNAAKEIAHLAARRAAAEEAGG